MTMKRRGFLKMFGGAIAAPMMPSVSFATVATKVGYPASAFHAAIYHAKSRVNFSAFSLAKRLDLQLPQAEALMADMSARGILGPIQGTTKAGQWALSRVWERPFVDAAAAQKLAKGKGSRDPRSHAKTSGADTPELAHKGVNLNPLLKHLRIMAKNQGFTLHPRCYEVA